MRAGARRPRLLLFDVDGTLLLSGGAGKRALNRAFADLFAVTDAFEGIPVAGRTDTLIFRDALARSSVETDQGARIAFYTRYYACLAEEIQQPGLRKGLMPGVSRLLERLAGETHLTSGLLTGNVARAARIKLEHFGLWRHFRCGAYGDDAAERDDLVPIAVARARRAGVRVDAGRDAVVIGDTPLDVRCAVAGGARSIAVATGGYDEATLRASGADAVLPDLADADRFLTAVAGDAEDAPRRSSADRPGWNGHD